MQGCFRSGEGENKGSIISSSQAIQGQLKDLAQFKGKCVGFKRSNGAS